MKVLLFVRCCGDTNRRSLSHRLTHSLGRMTVSIACTTPLLHLISAVTTFAPSMVISPSPLPTLMLSCAPLLRLSAALPLSSVTFLEFTEPAMTWFLRTAWRRGTSFSSPSSTAASILAKASSVGARTVKSPPLSVSTRPAAFTAATKVYIQMLMIYELKSKSKIKSTYIKISSAYGCLDDIGADNFRPNTEICLWLHLQLLGSLLQKFHQLLMYSYRSFVFQESLKNRKT